MDRPKVSVIIPVYNSEEYLPACLDSLLSQSLREIEIICVDDGSTDSSPLILQRYRQKDSRITIITEKNSGAGTARNTGLDRAHGEYLSFLDADDFFEPEMLENAYLLASRSEADLIVFGCNFYDNMSGEYTECKYTIRKTVLPEWQPFTAADIKNDVFKAFVGWAWDKLFRSDFVRENNLRFQEQRTTNDMLFVFSAIVKAESIITSDKVYAHHRRAQGSLSVTREKSWMCFYNALIALRAQLRAWGIYERFEQDYINYCVHFSLWNLNSLCEPTHTTLLNKLRNEWYDELGVTAHEKDYFYNKYEYSQYKKIMCTEGTDANLKQADSIRGNIFRRGYVCLRDNGLRYTVRNIRDKIKRTFVLL